MIKGREQWEWLLAQSDVDECWLAAYDEVEASCDSIQSNVDTRKKLAREMTACFLGIPVGDVERSLAAGGAEGGDRAFVSYTTFFAQVTHLCHYLGEEAFQQRTRGILLALLNASEETGDGLEHLARVLNVFAQHAEETSEQLRTAVEESKDAIDASHDELVARLRAAHVELAKHEASMQELSRSVHVLLPQGLSPWAVAGGAAVLVGILYVLRPVPTPVMAITPPPRAKAHKLLDADKYAAPRARSRSRSPSRARSPSSEPLAVARLRASPRTTRSRPSAAMKK